MEKKCRVGCRRGGFEFGKLFILSQFSIGAKFDHFNRFLRFAFSFEDVMRLSMHFICLILLINWLTEVVPEILFL